MENKRILVINQFASTPKYSTGAGERFFYLAEFFHQKGADITVLSAAYNHLFHKFPIIKGVFTREVTDHATYYWVKLRKYSPTSGIQRTIAFFEFLFKIFFFQIKPNEKPDLILVSSMSILPVYYAAYLKWKFKIPFVLEIRDIWPLTVIELGGHSPWHPFIQFLSFTEKFAYKKADYIVSVLPNFNQYLLKKGIDDKKFKWIPNGISGALDSNIEAKEHVKIDKCNFNVVYTGALGLANAMDLLVNAAIQVSDITNLHFIVVGDGPEKEKLVQATKNLSNIHFYDKVAKSEIQGILKQCDLAYIGWRAKDIYKYGVSANKYNDYMLAELPILSASGLSIDPVLNSKSGMMVEANNSEEIARALTKFYHMPKERREEYGKNGKKYLMETQTYEKLAEEYDEVFNYLLG